MCLSAFEENAFLEHLYSPKIERHTATGVFFFCTTEDAFSEHLFGAVFSPWGLS